MEVGLESRAVTSEPRGVTAQALLRVTPSAVIMLDPDGRVMSANRAACALLSTTEEEARGRPYTDIFWPSLADRLVPLVLRVVRSGRPDEPHEIVATLPDGRRATLCATARDRRRALDISS